ncbi:MAG TPA: UbiX family flavin prenyltransferase [Syntrophorhabdaceae bacterium]|nr:UbiX family flavin prenyltransferase [Syntrophorhabdaceae bacterium]HPP07231.1 UbiX family flavin prenyltransferase [Syntrophorhabdaceae bacterium]
MRRIIVAITGASGVIYGIRLLEVLKKLNVETHLIISEAGKKNIELETRYSINDVEGLASNIYENDNLAASISSGSYKTDGMVIIPCTIKTLSGIAHSFNNNLIIKAADVTLKEERRLVLVVRETPLHKGHLELMVRMADLGGIILPPVPAFYHKPKRIEDLIDHTVGKVLDLFHIDHDLFKRWEGIEKKGLTAHPS